MAVLSSTARKRLSKNAFVFPKERKYPIEDASHARNALARAAQHLGPDGQAKVKAAVKRRYPNIHVEGEVAGSRKDKAARRSKGD